MNKQYIIYDKTGLIIGDMICPELSTQQMSDYPENIIETSKKFSGTLNYIDLTTKTVKTKVDFPITIDKTSITADGVDAATISGIPSGSTLIWPDGQTDTITDGTASFSVDLAGTYKFILKGVPYLTKEITIEAVA